MTTDADPRDARAGDTETMELRTRTRNLGALAAVAAMAISAMPTYGGRRVRIKRRSGNKYRLCECGSFKPWANCCGATRTDGGDAGGEE